MPGPTALVGPEVMLPSHGTLAKDEPTATGPRDPKDEAIEAINTSRSGDEFNTHETPERAPRIGYKAICINSNGERFEISQDKPFTPQEPTRRKKDKPIIEVVTVMDVDGDDNAEQHGDNEKKKSSSLTNRKVLGTRKTFIMINSPHLSEIIRGVVDYYPQQNLMGENIKVPKPYPVLVHHWKKIIEVHARLQNAKLSDESKIRYEHLDILIGYLDPIVTSLVEPIKRRLAHDTPTTTWNDLWYLIRPGSRSYCKLNDEWIGCVVETVGNVEDPRRSSQKCLVEIWLLTTNHLRGTLGSASAILEIPQFEGELKVTDLPIYPQEYFDENDYGARKRDFEGRGDRVCDILWKGHECVNYDGELMNTGKAKYAGQIIISPFGDTGEELEMMEWKFNMKPEPVEKNKSSPCSGVLEKLWLDPEKHPKPLLTAAHKFIICPVLSAFTLPLKKWVPVHVSHTRELDPAKEIPEPTVSGDSLQIIKALAERQMTTIPWSADYIRNKGEGVVILLHGPPGVGKTYTVESIALRNRQPLISLTISEIGTREQELEAALTRWFSLAQKWHAVLLIDECDIFLERRERKDMARNGVVSAFLRKMEYFGGLLFLTTNRVGQIDDAFMSRVHAVVGFDELDGARSDQIWDSLLAKLARERRHQIRVSNGAKRFLKTAEVLKQMRWNGREIRNAFQTAIALAEYEAKATPGYDAAEAIIVEAEHFRQVMAMNRTFRSYLDSIRDQDEGERAQDLLWRKDYWAKTRERKRKTKDSIRGRTASE